jgi:hypothetical protein
MMACNHVPLKMREISCPLCGHPYEYVSPTISFLEESVMEYKVLPFEPNSVGLGNYLTVLNEWCKEEWRVVTSVSGYLVLERAARDAAK